MTEVEQRRKLLADIRDDLSKRQLSDSQNYDKAILSLSSAGLGVSLAFLARGSSIKALPYLWLSWIGFIGAIGATLASFLVSKRAIKRQLDIAIRGYANEEPDALKERNRPDEWVNRMAYISGTLFFLAICFTVCFVAFNIGGEGVVTKQPSTSIRTEQPITGDRRGQPVTTDRPAAPEQRGAGGAPLIPVIPDPPPASTQTDKK
ncbi:MAG: hypothetical protein ACRD88_17675 [Terriglobia bacterium]